MRTPSPGILPDVVSIGYCLGDGTPSCSMSIVSSSSYFALSPKLFLGWIGFVGIIFVTRAMFFNLLTSRDSVGLKMLLFIVDLNFWRAKKSLKSISWRICLGSGLTG